MLISDTKFVCAVITIFFAWFAIKNVGATESETELDVTESLEDTTASPSIRKRFRAAKGVEKNAKKGEPRGLGQDDEDEESQGGKGKPKRGQLRTLESFDTKPQDNYPKFKETSIWSEKYPYCNPVHNKHLSPIKIDRKKAILDKTTPTLLVYSGSPLGNAYVLNLNFTLSKPENDTYKFHMDALTLRLNLEMADPHDATYISGVGDVSLRQFHYAIFLFSKGSPPSGHSLHQIDDKKYPMEIVVFFSADYIKDEDTQVHILVKIGESENPMFVSLVRAAQIISDRITHLEKNYASAQEQYEHLRKLIDEYDAIVKKHKSEGVHENLKKLEQANKEAHASESQLKSAENDINKYELAKKTLEKSIPELEESMENTKSKLQALASQLEEKTKEFNELMENDVDAAMTLKAKIEELETALKKTEDKLKSDEAQLEKNRKRRKENEEKIEERKKQAEHARKSIGEAYSSRGFSFKNSKEAHTEVESLKKLKAEEERQKTEVLNEQQKLRKLSKELQIQENLEAFQLSWAMPAVGGHFAYNGSLPVPPCTKRSYTIVLEQPVEISKEQFDVLASIPRPKDGEPLQTCVPPLADLGNRKIHYVKKNLQYILDDMVHMKSKKRKQLKDRMKADDGSRLGLNFVILFMTLHFVLFGVERFSMIL